MHGTILKVTVSAGYCDVHVRVILHFRWPVTDMCYIQHLFIAVLCLTLGKTSQDCDHGQYYDPITIMCHPCSDCSDGRPGNIYCERGCKGEAEFVL